MSSVSSPVDRTGTVPVEGWRMDSPPHSSAEVKECDGETMLGLDEQGIPHDLLNLLGRFAGATNRTGAYQGRTHGGDFSLGPVSPPWFPCVIAPDPPCFEWTSEPCRAFSTYAELTSDVEAALNASQPLTGTVVRRDSSALNGRDWGTQDFLGRDITLTAKAVSQWSRPRQRLTPQTL